MALTDFVFTSSLVRSTSNAEKKEIPPPPPLHKSVEAIQGLSSILTLDCSLRLNGFWEKSQNTYYLDLMEVEVVVRIKLILAQHLSDV